jgi:hypothetical protein
MRKAITLVSALLFNAIVGATIALAAGINPVVGVLGAEAVASVPGFLAGGPATGILRAGIFRELWTGEMVKALRGGLEHSWLDGIPDYSAAVENDVIHLVDIVGDPDVLVNNTSYPIDIQALTDPDISISLDKFQTKATPITDDELHALSYDKMSRVIESHRNAIDDAKFAKAAWNFCAASNTAATPVLATTGERDAANGRLAMTRADLIAMKSAMDKLGVPAKDRRLVLCSDHVNDILGWSEEFVRQYNLDNINGKVGRLYGFDIYEASENPLYTSAGAKKDLGATASAGEFKCSFAFYTPRAFKASGSLVPYLSEAKNDPQNQQNLANFRHYFIAKPKKADAGVVMRSGYRANA